ncbi:hypothetical protein C6Q05_16710 [Burkholderia multivorans]|nr:hypothetical protein C6Q05_16710 [Burkholderia multivorans]
MPIEGDARYAMSKRVLARVRSRHNTGARPACRPARTRGVPAARRTAQARRAPRPRIHGVKGSNGQCSNTTTNDISSPSTAMRTASARFSSCGSQSACAARS